MKFIKIILLFSLSYTLICCHRNAVCPAYHNVDPTRSKINMSKEKFINNKKTENNKEEVEKQVERELKKRHNRKKSTNLFPSYMR